MVNPFNLVSSAVWRVAFAMRESGQALERVGCRLQGIYSFTEPLNRHQPVLPHQFTAPSVASDAFVAPSSLISGDVSIGRGSSIWYNAIVRGDTQPVTIGNNTNIQDGAIVGSNGEYSTPVEIGSNVSVGHGAIIKGAKVGDNALIGMNAVLSDNVKVGGLTIVAAGSFVEENAVIPAGEVWAGNPAKKIRDLKPQEREYLHKLPQRYTDMGAEHEQVMELLRMKQEEYSG